MLHIITANNLRNGLNVYFCLEGEKGSWDQDIGKARRFDADGIEAALGQAEKDVAGNLVVDCYSIDVTDEGEPLTSREKIRAGGPSIKYGPN